MNPGLPEGSDGIDLARVKGSTSVLVLGREMEDSVKQACNELLQPENPAESIILKISYHFSPTEIADRWQEHNPDSQSKVYGVSITDSSVSSKQSYGDQFSFKTVRAGDLTGLGMKINQIVGEVSTDTPTLLVCVDSLDSMLMYNDKQSVYRFIRTISNFLSSNNAEVHFHLDPSQHDDVVNTLKSAFNAIVEMDDDGIVNIKTR